MMSPRIRARFERLDPWDSPSLELAPGKRLAPSGHILDKALEHRQRLFDAKASLGNRLLGTVEFHQADVPQVREPASRAAVLCRAP